MEQRLQKKQQKKEVTQNTLSDPPKTLPFSKIDETKAARDSKVNMAVLREIFFLLTLAGACSHFQKKAPPIFVSSKGFQRGHCFFSEKNNLAPYISCKIGNKEYSTLFDKEYSHYEIINALEVEKSQVLYAILDYGIEGSLEIVPLLKSIDSGKSWFKVGEIKKPHFSFLIKEMKFSSPSKGFIKFEGDENQFSTSTTKDGGKTWSKSSF
jgi:hypothetical protein